MELCGTFKIQRNNVFIGLRWTLLSCANPRMTILPINLLPILRSIRPSRFRGLLCMFLCFQLKRYVQRKQDSLIRNWSSVQKLPTYKSRFPTRSLHLHGHFHFVEWWVHIKKESQIWVQSPQEVMSDKNVISDEQKTKWIERKAMRHASIVTTLLCDNGAHFRPARTTLCRMTNNTERQNSESYSEDMPVEWRGLFGTAPWHAVRALAQCGNLTQLATESHLCVGVRRRATDEMRNYWSCRSRISTTTSD